MSESELSIEYTKIIISIILVILVQLVKNPPAMQETWVHSLGWEDPVEKGKVTHSSILAWRIPGVTMSRTQLSNFHFFLSFCHLLSADDVSVVILKEIYI